MEYLKSASFKKNANIALILLVWAATAWLIYPLIVMKTVDIMKVDSFFYRSSGGIILMIVMLGKTIADLLMPQNQSRKKSVAAVAFLTVYSLALAVGVIVLVMRILVIYLKNNPPSSPL